MLSEEQLELMQERISNRFVKVNDEVLETIGTRIAEIGRVKKSDAYKLKRLLENGTDIKDVELRLAQATQKSLKDMEYMLERVAKENYEFSEAFYKAKGLEFVAFKDNVAINKKWQALYKQSSKELVNITKNTAFMAMVDGEKVPTLFQTLYNNVIDKAVIEASSGLIDYQSAMRKTIRDVADSGLRSVDYATGYSRRLDTAVRQNVLWALKECNQQVADMTGDEFGSDGFEVSYHSNPRPSHVAMGGREFSNKGDKRINGKLYADGTVVKELLGDYGCLHFSFPIILGVSEPTLEQEELTSLKASDAQKVEFEGTKMTKYEASQKQRQIETKVRHLKDRANIAKASGDDELRRETQSKINLLTSKYANLSKSANLPTKMERMGVRGFRAVKETKIVKLPIVDEVAKKVVISEQTKKAIYEYSNGGYGKYCNYSQWKKDGTVGGKIVDDYKEYARINSFNLSDIYSDEIVETVNNIEKLIKNSDTDLKLVRLEENYKSKKYDYNVGDRVDWGIRSTSSDVNFVDKVFSGEDEGLYRDEWEFFDKGKYRFTEFEIIGKKNALSIKNMSAYETQDEFLVSGSYKVKSVNFVKGKKVDDFFQTWDEAIVDHSEKFEFFTSKAGKKMVKVKETGMVKSVDSLGDSKRFKEGIYFDDGQKYLFERNEFKPTFERQVITLEQI